MDFTRFCKSLPVILLCASLLCACGGDDGEKEAETDSVSVRTRKGTDGGAMSVDEFVQMICEEIREKRR